MTLLDSLSWDREKRAVFFRPWWRALVTVGLAVPALALTPAFARDPELATWLGPAVSAPMFVWLMVGFRQIHNAGRRASAPPVNDTPA